MEFDMFFEETPYSWDKEKKREKLTSRLKELTNHHKKNCKEYENILNCINYSEQKVDTYEDLPFLPVRLFKELHLKSIGEEDVVKTMTSSGTTGQSVSRIYLDKETSYNQQKAMVKIVSDYTGSSRMPMIIVDCPSVIKDRNMFSARGAGILGFSIFGSKKMYALNDDMKLDVNALGDFLEKYRGQKVLLFGFTFMVWQYFYKELVRLKENGIVFDLTNGILIHGGGWKKLANEAVSAQEFHDRFFDVCGLNHIHDYYGMVEQTGCIYMQCERGHLHASNFSDVIIRNPKDFSVCNIGEKGIIQVVSSIAKSYPGHSLLTEDEGVILGEDDCKCGRKGKYFKIIGRIKNAEIRGCSDTFATNLELSKDNKIKYLVGDENVINNIANISTKRIFDQEVLEFMNEVSGILMKDINAKVYPDVITLAFWLRKASLNRLRDRFYDNDYIKVGRGTVFHIAPSNVPVNYAYSLFASLMCGNANIVRVSSKEFPQVDIINNAITKGIEKYPSLQNYICIVRYDKNNVYNDKFSEICDVRTIWGGDATINELRKSPIGPRTTEVTFSDRYSLAVIDSELYLKTGDKDKIVKDFYNDTYLFDQNACTSPRIIVWTGNRISEAKNEFWELLHSYVKDKYELQTVVAVDKLTTEYIAAAKHKHIVEESKKDNTIVRVRIENKCQLNSELMDYRGNSGFFYEYEAEDIIEIRDICNDMRCQTIGYIGNKDMLIRLIESGIKGVDRIVPIGHTMDFDLIWDGYNLVDRFSRVIDLI